MHLLSTWRIEGLKSEYFYFFLLLWMGLPQTSPTYTDLYVDVWRVRASCELHTPPDLQTMTILEGNYWIIYYLISSWNTARSAALAGETAPVLGLAEQQAWLASWSNTCKQQQITSWCRSKGGLSPKLRGQRSDPPPGWSPAAFLSS